MTLTDLYRKALEKMEVVSAGEPAAPEDTQFMATKYVALWNLLKINGIVSWAIDEAVPDEAAQPLIEALAFLSADEFGDEKARYLEGAIGLDRPSLAERQLRQLHAHAYVSEPAQSEYF